jgi:thiamine biosynthesis lipoprotein
MGTRVRLLAAGEDREVLLARLGEALLALERTDRELSTWQPESAISRFNRRPVGDPWATGEPLCAMFADVFAWQRETAGAFDPAVGALTAAWGLHTGGLLPSPATLRDARARSGSQLLRFDSAACTLTRLGDTSLDVGAFGKGAGLDRAARALDGVRWLIDLGGQVAVGGDGPDGDGWLVDIAHPARRDVAQATVRLHAGSLATSGGSERDLQVGGQRVSHILDPRTGEPATFTGSASVWHRQALAADALSTALYVMGPDAGLPWAESRGLSALYLIADGDLVHTRATGAFRRLLVAEPAPRGHLDGTGSASARGRAEGQGRRKPSGTISMATASPSTPAGVSPDGST